MKVQSFFYNKTHRLRTLWRILIFCGLLSITILPLIFIDNSHLQFFGALLILIFGLYINSKFLDKIRFSDYGLSFKKKTFGHLSIGILIGSLAVLLIFVIGQTLGTLTVYKAISVPKLDLILPFALKMLLVAILEETFFRGYLFTTIYDGLKSSSMTKRHALITALVLSSVIFGVAHFSNNNASIMSIIFLSINGMVWCIPFVVTRNLGFSIGLHASWNFTQTLIGFSMSGNEALNSFYIIQTNDGSIFSGGAYGPEAGLLGLLGFFAMLVFSLAYLKLTKKRQFRELRPR